LLILVACGGRDDSSGQTPNHEIVELASPLSHAAESRVSEGEAPVGNVGRSGNPAEWPNVRVYRPRKLNNVRYDGEKRLLTDLATGDRLTLRTGHAGGPGHVSYSNEKTGGIAYGAYYNWSSYEQNLLVYNVSSLRTEIGSAPQRAREEFEIGRLAELFRASYEAAVSPNRRKEVLVVDSRPEQAAEIDRVTGETRSGQ
jgi:hypothetical protein